MVKKSTLAFSGFILSSYLAVSSLASFLRITVYDHHTIPADPGGFAEGIAIISLFILCIFLFLADYRRRSSGRKLKIGFVVLLVYSLSRLVRPIISPQNRIELLSNGVFLVVYCVVMLIVLYKSTEDDDRETAIRKDR